MLRWGWTKEIHTLSREYDRWGKTVAWNVPAEEIFEGKTLLDPADWHEASCYKGLPVKETCDGIAFASDEFMQRHGYIREGSRYRVIKHNDDKIAVFGHGGFGLTWLAHLL